jgi:hypothetical protein
LIVFVDIIIHLYYIFPIPGHFWRNMMKKTPLHQSIIDVLAANPDSVMSEAEIIANVGVLPAMGMRAIYELRTEASPLIERVQMDGGVFGCKIIADPEVLAFATQRSVAPIAASAPAPAASAPVAAAEYAEEPLAAPQVNGFTFGQNKVADQLLTLIKTAPQTGSDLLMEMEVAPEDFIKATRELEKTGIVVTTPMEIGSDNDIVFQISEELREDVINALSHEFEYADEVAPAQVPVRSTSAKVHMISSAAFRPQTQADEPAASVAEPKADQPKPVVAVVKSPSPADKSAGSKLGAVAQREERQRKEAIAAITKILSEEGTVSKVEVFDRVVDTFTVRGLKELLKELIDDGTLVEVRDGKNKFLELGKGELPKAAPKEQKAPKETPPKVEQVKVAAATPAPAAKVEEPVRQPVAAVERVASQPVREPKAVLPSVSALVSTDTARAAGDQIPEAAANPSDILSQLVDRVKQLEAENKFYRDLFSQMKLPEKFA